MSTYIQKRSKTKLRVGDLVKVIAGDHKGEQGVITKFFLKKHALIIKGVNMVTKHKKPNASNPQGGISSIEAPIHISNVMLLEDDKPVRLGYKFVDSKKTRFSRITEKEI